MNPGERVASPRSITFASLGIATLLPTSKILSPCTTTTPFITRDFDLPSNIRAAFSATTAADGPGAGVWAKQPTVPTKPTRAKNNRNPYREEGEGVDIMPRL